MSVAGTEAPLFRGRTIVAVTLASIVAAAAFFLLSTYAPDHRSTGRAQATSSGIGAVGFAGLYRLLEETGVPIEYTPETYHREEAGLMIVPLDLSDDPDRIAELAKERQWKATLFVLPKWNGMPIAGQRGWLYKAGKVEPRMLDRLLAPLGKVRMMSKAPRGSVVVAGRTVRRPEGLQLAAAPEAEIAVGGGALMFRPNPEQPHYVLSDPDILNNLGLADLATARAAIALIEELRPNDDMVMFDETLHVVAAERSLAKLLVEPPFLAVTLTLFAAAAMALLHGFARFGPAQSERRVLAFGKRALADSSARLVRRAGRLSALGGPWARLRAGRAAARLRAPAGLAGEALNEWIDGDRGGLAPRMDAVMQARDEAGLVVAARDLESWIERRVSEGR